MLVREGQAVALLREPTLTALLFFGLKGISPIAAALLPQPLHCSPRSRHRAAGLISALPSFPPPNPHTGEP